MSARFLMPEPMQAPAPDRGAPDRGALEQPVPAGPAVPAHQAGKPVEGPASLLFHEPWWLSAVTGGQYEEVTVSSGGQVVGRLPFVIKRKFGLTSVRMPPFTHLLGPAVDAGSGKSQTQVLRRLSIVRALLDQLPDFHIFKQALHPEAAHGLAFQDRGFQVSPQYTFRIDCRREMDALWRDMHSKTRQHIRRAEEKFSVSPVEDPDMFVRFYQANLDKSGRRNRICFKTFSAVFEESTGGTAR